MRFYWLLFFAFLSIHCFSQQHHCGTDQAMEIIYKQNPRLKLNREAYDKNAFLGKPGNASYVIPVVFHVLHLGGPENVSDAQVKDALRILNRDFAKENPDTTEIIPFFKNLADSAKIQFALATKDPQGNCTNGILHYFDPKTDWDEDLGGLFHLTWDPTKYMNVYVVRKIVLGTGFQASGYTYLPGTWPAGNSKDAIVILNNYFGSIGTSSAFLSRVLTHEAAHWLNVYHVFGANSVAGSGCSGDDFVSDTPPTIGYIECPNPNTPLNYQWCTPGQNENFQNYMDYSYCVRMFTPGQCQRMQAILQTTISGRDNLVSSSNLIATGVTNPNTACIPVADFKFSRVKTCAGTPITFTDASWNGQPTSYNWSFPGGTPSASTSSVVTVVYPTPGNYSIVYFTANAAGTSATITKTNVIQVTANTPAFAAPWSEGFENQNNFNTHWTLESSGGGTYWYRDPMAAHSGIACAKLHAFSHTRKNISTLTSPLVDFSNSSNPQLFFWISGNEILAHHSNTLNVYASTDCGDVWNKIYSKNGLALKTTTKTNAYYIPSADDWRQESVDLQSLAASPAVLFKFEYVRDSIASPSNFHLDDINIMSTTSIYRVESDLSNVSVFPVPSEDYLNISFYLQSPQKLKIYLTDLSGRYIGLFTDKEYRAGENIEKISLKNKCQAGMYLLRIEPGGGVPYLQKIIVR